MRRLNRSSGGAWIQRLILASTCALLAFGTSAPVLVAPAATPIPSGRPTSAPKAPAVRPATPRTDATNVKPGQVPGRPKSLPARTAPTTSTGASASLPASTCPSAGGSQQCELWALTGSVTVAGGPPGGMPIWGFSAAGATGPALVPGPTLVAVTGQPLSVVLHNGLPGAAGNLSLEVPAATVAPDIAGVATGGSRTYSLGTLVPGTYLYQAGPTPSGSTPSTTSRACSFSMAAPSTRPRPTTVTSTSRPATHSCFATPISAPTTAA